MIYQYVVSLKNQGTRYINLFGILLSLASAVFFLRELVLEQHFSLAYLVGVVAVVGFISWNAYWSYRGHKVFYSRALLIAALVWMKMPYLQWVSFLLIILALLEYQAKYAVEIGFSEKQIVINSLFKKRISWSQLSNIILKDGLLTMDFLNNRILQKEVEDDEEDDADEDEFNNWCRLQLEKVRTEGKDQL
ncbi:MAG: hypothetical protein P0Y53_20170 [Candidatus Pseudobacter hemicellulosilyticus]|uniref:Uncharacterized protein n=1 Tax=Candidatus Pseudobacter hemicellulosilyticus TaxID=3121375 RepID=A0AAJ5WQA5_9BACT|nr:MAG: hypothetical protein P0Y53_20170 [Pseudobacter sp.]